MKVKEMEIEKESCDESVKKYDGEYFSDKQDLITIEIKNFNPEDQRIKTLLDGFHKKAKELGFKTSDTGEFDTGLGQIRKWDSGNWEVYLTSY